MQKNQIYLKFMKIFKLIFLLFFTSVNFSFSQEKIDGIIASVGSHIILKSDLEQQILQYKSQGAYVDSLFEAQIFEDLLFQKLLIHKSEIDSIEVSDNEIQNELNNRLQNYINQLGGEDQLENYFNKNIFEIKDEMYTPIKNSLIVQKSKYEITSSIKITPTEVYSYFQTFNYDSLPIINQKVMVAQILKFPPPTIQSIEETKNKLEKLKERVVNGESFATLAILYSEDPGSSRNGGLYTSIRRGMFVREFESVMFSLEEGEISNVFQTEYGYHILRLEKRKRDNVDIRHILMSPKISPIDLNNTRDLMSDIRDSLILNKISFSEASKNNSDDLDTKYNGGKLINLSSGDSFFELHELENSIKLEIEKLNENEITQPLYVKLDNGKEAYRLFKLIKRINSHKANLKDDYKKISQMALEKKKNDIISKWIEDEIKKTHIYIDNKFKSFNLQYNWLNI